jgi:uncharacterized protein (DUF608 family)
MKTTPRKPKAPMARRDFIRWSAIGAGSVALAPEAAAAAAAPDGQPILPVRVRKGRSARYHTVLKGDRLNRVAFPMGGLGAGMICLEGTGALSHVSLRHRPEVFHEPCQFAALCVKGSPNTARVLEGPVPDWKKFGGPGAGNGAAGASFGLPRFRGAEFSSRFPFATVTLRDPAVALAVQITGWSPFEAGDPDNASLPVAALEYRFTNRTRAAVDAVFSYHAKNFMTVGSNANAVKSIAGGFVLWGSAPKERGWEEGHFAACVDDPAVKVNHSWFRGGWWDGLTMVWKSVQEGGCLEREPVTEGGAAPGASLYVPFRVEPGQTRTVVLRFAWYVGQTNLKFGKDVQGAEAPPAYKPWYAQRFAGINEVSDYWRGGYGRLREASQRFSDCFHDTTLPAEVVEAVAANLSILKSPTVLRQADGALWAFEGCGDAGGCCHGSCTHVWNYAQALPHLFPTLERSLRETEFGASQDARGHQQFRSALPVRAQVHDFHAAADGQLGGIMKVHREWRISGDLAWLRGLWPKVKGSMDYCIATWDPEHKGWLEEPHHNTYDIEFWGPDGMCTSFYLGGLAAAIRMGQALGEDVRAYEALLREGTQRTCNELFDGEYFIQKIRWQGLRAKSPIEEIPSFGGGYSPEARVLLEKEGPKYQYGAGCLADGVLGSWIALVCGVGQVLDPVKIRSHLRAVYRHNLKRDLSDYPNPQRPSYACGAEGGLLLCTWPKGGELSLPFVYSNEVWTGIEYQVASHLIFMGLVEEGLEIVRICRDRYDGRVRNPFNEYECGHWYARAMASYGLLQAISGARYDAVEKKLYLSPRVKGDFRCFLATAGGYGVVGIKQGRPFVEVKAGRMEIEKIELS